MDVLDSSPLEPLALNYLSFGFSAVVNNLWAWIAVITAAVSFWRIRAAAAAAAATTTTTAFSVRAQPPQQQKQRLPQACFDRCSKEASRTSPSAQEPASESEPPSSVSASQVASPLRCAINGGGNGVTKGWKFAVYYEGDDESESESEDEDGEVAVVGQWGSDGDGEWWRESNWERVMRMRMGDLGWYRCQDLTAINGNVVRLWGRNEGTYS